MAPNFLWLDDRRPPPSPDWLWVKTALEAIKALRRDTFEVVSLDHDLGEEDSLTGYDVLTYIEVEVHRNPEFKLPEIRIHTQNPVGRQRMLQAVASIERFRPLG